MKTYRIRFDMVKFQPSALQCERAGFGPDNAGITQVAASPEAAVQRMNDGLLAGMRLNPFYLKVEEVRT